MKDLLIKLKLLYAHLKSGYDCWVIEVWERDLDELHCCDGRMCGCGGLTIREIVKPNKENT